MRGRGPFLARAGRTLLPSMRGRVPSTRVRGLSRLMGARGRRRRSGAGAFLLLAALLATTPGPVTGQGASAGASVPSVADAASPLRSLVVPGWGQLHQGNSRGWAYLALEAVAWFAFGNRTLAGRDLRDRYRDLAWERARVHDGARRDGDFAYYEFMSKWTSSGAFDADTSRPGIQPETDPSTFNGSIWALAAGLYLPPSGSTSDDDPAYQRALGYYVGRAYGPGFLWDWSADPEARQRFGRLIHRSDERFREATTALGVILANHLVSFVDAYLSSAGGGTGEPPGAGEGPLRDLRFWWEPGLLGPRVGAGFRVVVP